MFENVPTTNLIETKDYLTGIGGIIVGLVPSVLLWLQNRKKNAAALLHATAKTANSEASTIGEYINLLRSMTLEADTGARKIRNLRVANGTYQIAIDNRDDLIEECLQAMTSHVAFDEDLQVLRTRFATIKALFKPPVMSELDS